MQARQSADSHCYFTQIVWQIKVIMDFYGQLDKWLDK